MKPSAYNHRTELPDGTVLLFNFYTLNLVELDPWEAEVARHILADPLASPGDRADRALRKLLIEEGFLIRSDVNEREYLQHFHYQARTTQRGDLSLTILPSLSCNFRCIYCYETPDQSTMTDEVIDAVTRLADARVAEEGRLSVTWFGGEPLLQMKIIERLSHAFIGICRERAAQYSAFVVTNGYLLTDDVARQLAELKVNRAQVTLDGPPEIHDTRRPTVGGKKTFTRIVENLSSAAAILPISLRINVDRSNREHVTEILDMLVERGLQGRVSPYLGHTFPYNEVCGDVAGYCMADSEFSLFDLEFEMELIRRGFGSVYVPRAVNTYCMAENPNAFVITPSGGIDKCWNNAAEPDAEVAHLLRPQTKQMMSNADTWSARDPFTEECADCKLLPICMGGCPHIRKITGRVHCHEWKHHLDESLAAYYLVQKMRGEAQIGTAFQEVVSGIREVMATRTH